MKNIKLIVLGLMILTVSLGTLFAQDQKKHCGTCPTEGKEVFEEKIGVIENSGTSLVLTTDSSKTKIKLYFTEKSEAKADSIIVGNVYAVKGKTVKSGFMVHDLCEKTKSCASEKVEQVHKVIPEKCISCKLCVKNCPVGAITMVKGKAVIDQEKCTDCGICIDGNGKFRGCPVKAIEVTE